MAPIASPSSEKSSAPRFSRSGAADVAFGIGSTPRCTAHRSATCAGVRPYRVATTRRTGSASSASAPVAKRASRHHFYARVGGVGEHALCCSRGWNSTCRSSGLIWQLASVSLPWRASSSTRRCAWRRRRAAASRARATSRHAMPVALRLLHRVDRARAVDEEDVEPIAPQPLERAPRRAQRAVSTSSIHSLVRTS